MARHALDDVIGAHRRVTFRHAVQNVAALAGEARAPPLAGALGTRQKFRGAILMVVVWHGE
jgi:hypothetical protein